MRSEQCASDGGRWYSDVREGAVRKIVNIPAGSCDTGGAWVRHDGVCGVCGVGQCLKCDDDDDDMCVCVCVYVCAHVCACVRVRLSLLISNDRCDDMGAHTDASSSHINGTPTRPGVCEGVVCDRCQRHCNRAHPFTHHTTHPFTHHSLIHPFTHTHTLPHSHSHSHAHHSSPSRARAPNPNHCAHTTTSWRRQRARRSPPAKTSSSATSLSL